MGLVFYEDNYYLICYHHYYKHPFAFRIDRMSDVDFTDQEISSEVRKLTRDTDFSALTEQAFKMYSGEPGTVRIRFISRLIGTSMTNSGRILP